MVFFAFVRFHYCFRAQTLDEGEAHLSHCCRTVEPAFLFHLKDEVFECFLLILRELQSVEHYLVAFHELRGGETYRYLGTLCMVLDEVHDAVQAAVHGTVVVVFVAEVLTHRLFLIFRHVDSVVDELVDTLVFCR